MRFKDATILDLFEEGQVTKPRQIEPILDAFPGRDFLLVGDSGEGDPEVYGALARDRPGQIRHVYVRNVTGEDRTATRFRDAFAGVPDDRWTLFEDPAELTAACPR